MKTEREFPKFVITKKGTRWVEGGHPWIYEAEVMTGPVGEERRQLPIPENGSLVDAVSEGGKYLGTGFLSLSSRIRIRLISRNANDRFDAAFWKRRIRYAWDYRKQVMGEDISCCRVIFGEADAFPGLTVDRYNDLLVTEVLSFGMEKIKGTIYRLLKEVLAEDGVVINGIYERNEAPIRALEGLPQEKGWWQEKPVMAQCLSSVCPAGDVGADMLQRITDRTCSNTEETTVDDGRAKGTCVTSEDRACGTEALRSSVTEIVENGVRYKVDVENGQKTGFFLDQKYNRLAVAKYAKGKKVLDCFTHTGSFALNAALGGAAHVTAVDVSAFAIEMAKENARLNGLEKKLDFVTADVFELLTILEQKGGAPYDFIILDPPAFTKARSTVKNAERGYKDINYRALRLLPRGGYLATASCSHFMEDALFVKMLQEAARDAGKALRQIEARQQAPDHPILWNVPETSYLKFYIFQVI